MKHTYEETNLLIFAKVLVFTNALTFASLLIFANALTFANAICFSNALSFNNILKFANALTFANILKLSIVLTFANLISPKTGYPKDMFPEMSEGNTPRDNMGKYCLSKNSNTVKPSQSLQCLHIKIKSL